MFCLGSPVTRFVHSNPLFAYVEDKEEASDRLLAVEALPETDTKLKDLHLLFTKGPMTIRGPLFQETHFDELVVLAHIRGLISIHQLGTAFYFKSAVDHYGLSRLTVCDNLPPSYTPPNKLEAFTSQTMTTLQMLLKNQPASERFCLLTPITEALPAVIPLFKSDLSTDTCSVIYPETPTREKTPTVIEFTDHVKSSLFSHTFYRGVTHRIIPSITMVQLACSPSLHPNALHCFRTKMAFHFGMTDSLRHNGLMGTRDISLRSSFAPLPETADSFWAPGEIFTSHDLLYHFILVNYIPLDHQKLFIALADACKEEGHPDLAAVYEDMECTNYTVKPLDNLPYKFINAVKFLARHTVDAKASDDLAKALRDGDTKGASARITSYQTTRDALRQKNETLALQILESLLIKPPITPVKREILHALKTQSE